MALASKTAETLAATFQQVAPIGLSWLAAMSRTLFMIRECDNDSSNTKALNLEWASLSAQHSNVCQKRHYCYVHQLNMLAGRLLIAGSPSNRSAWLVSGYFNASHLLRNPGYFDDLVLHLSTVIHHRLRLMRGQPDPEQVAANYATFRMLGFTHTDATTLVRLFGGNITNLSIVEFWCDEPGLVDCRMLAHEMATCIKHLCYRTLPDIPIPARWMRVSSTFRWWATVLCIHGIGLHTHNCTFDPAVASCMLPIGVATHATTAAPVPNDDDDEPDFGNNAKYNKSVGVRVRRSLTFFLWDGVVIATLLNFQLADLAAQPIAHLLSQSAERHANLTSAIRPVPLLDLLFPPCSIIVWTGQCFGAVLSRPVYKVFAFAHGLRHGLPHHAAWSAYRMAVESIASSYVRMDLRITSWNNRYLSIADTRHPPMHTRFMSRAFSKAKQCCLPAYDAAAVHSMVLAESRVSGYSFESVLASAAWQSSLLQVAMSTDLNTADVEDIHAAHRQMAPDGTGMETLGATSVLRQVSSASRTLSLEAASHASQVLPNVAITCFVHRFPNMLNPTINSKP